MICLALISFIGSVCAVMVILGLRTMIEVNDTVPPLTRNENRKKLKKGLENPLGIGKNYTPIKTRRFWGFSGGY